MMGTRSFLGIGPWKFEREVQEIELDLSGRQRVGLG